MCEISWSDFEKIDIRVGTIIEVKDFPKAKKPAYKLEIDFGQEIGIKKSSAQITNLYKKQDLVGMQVVAVINFPDKQIGPFMSQCLVTGFKRDDNSVVLTVPQNIVPNGARLV